MTNSGMQGVHLDDPVGMEEWGSPKLEALAERLRRYE